MKRKHYKIIVFIYTHMFLLFGKYFCFLFLTFALALDIYSLSILWALIDFVRRYFCLGSQKERGRKEIVYLFLIFFWIFFSWNFFFKFWGYYCIIYSLSVCVCVFFFSDVEILKKFFFEQLKTFPNLLFKYSVKI